MNDDQNIAADDEPLDPETKAFLEAHEDVRPEVEEEKRVFFLVGDMQMSLYDFTACVMNYDEAATPADLERWTAALRSLAPGQSLDLRGIGCGEGVVTRVARP